MNKKLATALKVILVLALLIVAVVMITMLLAPKEDNEIKFSTLIDEIKSDKIEQVIYYSGNQIRIMYKNNSVVTDPKQFPKKFDKYAYGPGYTEYSRLMAELQTDANYGAEGGFTFIWGHNDYTDKTGWISSLIPILAIVGTAVLMFFIYRQSMGSNSKAMSFGKTKARLNSNIKVRFSDVAGAEEEKEELAEIVEFLKNPKKFEDVGARIPKGVLLVGPPGTGKTLFAKAVAGEANVPFFSISGSDFVEMFVGTGAARVRDLFDQAKHNMPCIIFIDEIDAVGRQRGAGLGGGHDEREQTLNQLLVQMDGFEKNDGIIIMAATNRADILDPALLRPGRFDRQIYVNIPDVIGREEIFKVHSRNKPLAPDVSFKILARMTAGFSGADIENLLNEASILAARAGRKVIIMEDVLEGINKVIAGPQKRSRKVTESDKRITAYHEAGHAIIAKLLPGCDEVQEVSIIPRGMAAGYTLTRPVTDDDHVTKSKLNDTITMMLGGRVAEEIVIHDVSTGASNDIERASEISRKMVTEWGMSEALGTIFLGGAHEVFLGKDYGQASGYSEAIQGSVDTEVKKILDDNYKRAKEILQSNRTVLDNMVKVLFEKETIYTAEVDMLFEGKSAEEVCKYIDERVAKNESLRMEAIEKSEAEEKKSASEQAKELKEMLDRMNAMSDSAKSEVKNTDSAKSEIKNTDSEVKNVPEDNEKKTDKK